MILLLLLVLFIWAWIDSGFLAGVEVVILAGIFCWLLSVVLQIGRKMFQPRVSLTQNNYERGSEGKDPTAPEDEHPLLQLHNYKRLH